MFRISRIVPLIAVCAAIVCAPHAKASLQTGDLVRFGNGPGSPGGIFYLKDTGGTKITDTFCVDLFEYIRFDKTYQVANAFGTATIAGGLPLTSFTAWLFDQYLDGTLSNFDFSNVYGQTDATAARIQANELQLAIWVGMGYSAAQIGGVGAGWYSTYDGQLAGWQADFLSDGTWSGTGDVYIVNLLGQDSSGEYTVNVQDQLIRIPGNVIPEPLSAVIWLFLGAGAFGVAQLRRN